MPRSSSTVAALLECGPEALRAQKALLRQWEELPLKESVNLSIGVFGQSFLTDEPQRLMQGFIDRKIVRGRRQRPSNFGSRFSMKP